LKFCHIHLSACGKWSPHQAQDEKLIVLKKQNKATHTLHKNALPIEGIAGFTFVSLLPF
jgi:hypothetical protein